MKTNSPKLFIAFAAFLSAAITGCGSADEAGDAVSRANSTNIIRAANLYNSYQYRNGMKGPADESALKSFVTSLDAATMKRVGVDPATPESVFVSERDGQPFKIRYGIGGSMMGSFDPVVFEATGVDSKREVGFLNMTQREVDDAEYEQLWSGNAPAATPARQR